jgi:hypothetical protein
VKLFAPFANVFETPVAATAGWARGSPPGITAFSTTATRTGSFGCTGSLDPVH